MKKTTIYWLAAALTVIGITGCAANYRNPTDTAGAPNGTNTKSEESANTADRTTTVIKGESDVLIDYYLTMRKAPRDKAMKEYADVSKIAQAAPTSFNRIKQALLLSLPVTGLQDNPRALNLLQETIKEEKEEDNNLRNLANLLQGQLYKETRHDENMQRAREDQKRLETLTTKQDEAIQSLTTKLKDEQKRYDTLQSSIQTKQEDSNQTVAILAQKLKDEQKRADNLQQKLDALTNIERTIIERQQQGKPDPKK